ncbi:hypothetical protein HWV62_21632 [Athelia sp. TMB]|nr:hypothetical protein HWV62_33327 [Athelia sp. TMB]KAF7971223.1 hypothetical protein HWV62_21632 [Athelia sp. TMB]
MSEAKLKSLKVVDLKDILAKASVAVPAKANKQDLIKLILGTPAALEVYARQQNPNVAPSSAADDLLAPPEDFDWDGDSTDAPSNKEPAASKETGTEGLETAKPASKAAAKPASPPKKAAPAAPAVVATTEQFADDTVDEELEKRRKRAERFGVPLVETPKPTPPAAKKGGRNAAQPKPAHTAAAAEDSEKLNARAARFGTAKAPSAVVANKKRPVEESVDPEELERRKKRAERFGIPTASKE